MNQKKGRASLIAGAAGPQKPAYLADFVAIASDAIITFGPDGKITFWNPAAERMYGWTARQAVGKTANELFWPLPTAQDRKLQRQRQKRLLAGETVRGEYRATCRDGSSLWAEYTLRAVFDPAGDLTGYVAIHRDIQERKRTEQSLTEFARQQQALYQLTDKLHRTVSLEEIFDTALAGILAALQCDRASILLFDESGVMRFTAWRGLSEAYRKAADGHSPWTPDEKNPQPVRIEDSRAVDLGEPLNAVIRREGIRALAFVPLVSNGRLIGKFMVYFNAPHAFSEGEMELCQALARQLAFGLERNRADRKLRESEALYRTIARSIPGGGVYVMGRDLRYLVAEGPVTEAYDLTREMLEGRTVAEVFTPEQAGRMQARFERNLAGETVQYETTYKDRVYWTKQAPLEDSIGRIIIVTQDITERKRAEEALRASEQRYRSLFHSVPIAVYTCDAEGRIKEFNQSAVDLWGRAPRLDDPGEKYCGSFRIHYPDGRLMPHAECPMSRALAGETLQPHELEVLVERPDGGRRNILAHPLVLRNEHGEIVEAVNCLYDVTDRRQAEARLQLLDQVGGLVRQMTDPDEFLFAVAGLVGEHLQAGRAFFVEIDRANNLGFVRRDYCRGLPSIAGHYRLSDYSAEASRQMDLGHSIVNRDSRTDPRTAPYYEKTYGPNRERAYVAVPLMRDGQRVAALWVSSDAPREWDAEQVALLETVAERAWLAVEKMRLDKEVRRERELLQKIFDNIPVMITRYRPDTRLLQLNPAFERLTGWTAAEAREADLMAAIYPDPAYREEVRRFMESADSQWKDILMTARDGRVIETTWANVRLSDDTQVGIGLDITQRKQMEAALRQSEERFVRFMEHLPGLAWIKDTLGRYVYVNASAEKAFRTPRERLYGKTDQDIFPLETAAQFTQNDRNALAEGRGLQVIETLKHGDGVLHYSLVSKFPIPGPDGQPSLVGGTAFDITERKTAEEALRASEERFRNLSNAVPSIVWTAAADGTILYANDHWYKYTGLTPEENAAGWTERVLHPDDHDRCVRAWTHAIRTVPDEYLIEVRNRRFDGQYRWFQTRAIPTRDAEGNVSGWYGVTTDIHDRIEAENALRENQKELRALNETLEQKVLERTVEVRRLASRLTRAEQRERHRIAHILHDDLQQRLYAIQMQVDFLRRENGPADTDTGRDLADLKNQLEQVLALTRHLSIDLSPPILHDEGLTQAIGWLASQMREQHGLQIDLQADGAFALPDEDLQVLIFNCVRELLFNIVKHAGVNQAAVSLQRLNADLKIEVRDQGRGFQTSRAPGAGADRAGSSFGLPTLRHQLGLFGGQMDIVSEPGAGTRITLTLPVFDAPPRRGNFKERGTDALNQVQ